MNDSNIPETSQNTTTSPKSAKPTFPGNTWVKPVEILTKEEKSWMWRTNRSKAAKMLLSPFAGAGNKRAALQRKLAKAGRTELVIPESLAGIDAINKQLLSAINDKYKEATILDIARTMEILSGIKAKEMKDAMELQARNYTPTVITQCIEKAPDIIQDIDKPIIDNTDSNEQLTNTITTTI